MTEVEELGRRSKAAAARLAPLKTEEKDRALEAMAAGLEAGAERIIQANDIDLQRGRERGLSSALIDRLTLNEGRICQMAEGLRDVIGLRDPVGEVVDGWRLPNGLRVEKLRVPLGVVAVIYEARPNVTVDAAGLCLKSGNAVILRGSSSAIDSNTVLTEIIASEAVAAGIPPGSIQLVTSVDRNSAVELMKLRGFVDVLIPRGGAELISTVVENSTVPVIETGVGNCHVYVDSAADLQMAVDIVINAKTQRPGVCNACETVLVHQEVAEEFLNLVSGPLAERGVSIRGCPRTLEVIEEAQEACQDDWYEEYLDLILAVKVVDGIEEAMRHINHYGSGHSDAIVTSDYERANAFTEMVDSAAVYINASTRFTDGGVFQMGAEIGISTQKLHARGPMSLPELTTCKYVVRGFGQVR